MLHQVLLHAKRHRTHGALVRLPVLVHHPLVLVHRVGVGELPVAFGAFYHDAFVEYPDVLGQL